jgi:beta-glucuronidase
MLLCILAASVLRFASSAPLLRAGSAAEARVRACAPLYVSPSGSDAEGDGSLGSPWATWSHAAAAVRGLLPLQACDVSVYFLSGVYPLTSAVRLSAADSGRNGFSVVYSAAPGASVVFDGGQPLDGWAPLAGAPGVFCAPLGFATRDAFAFGARIAESVAAGVNLTARNTEVTAAGYVTTDAGLIAAVAGNALAAAADVELIYTSQAAQWQESRARVASWAFLNASALAITMAQPGWALVRGKGYPEKLPSALVNLLAPAALAAGEGVISPSARRVCYRPAAGADMAGARAWAGAVDGELVLLEGVAAAGAQPAQFVQMVRVENLTLRGATWLAPTVEGAYAPDQGGIVYRARDLPGPLPGHGSHPVPGALTLRTAANVTVRNVAVDSVGGSAVAVEGGSQDILISRARVTDAGCSGVRLGAVALADETDPRAFDARLTIADCTLTRLAQTYRDCSGIFGGYIRDSRVEHNNLSFTNWAGLTLGWGGWGGAPLRPSLGGNKILGNAISRVNLVTGDGGPIYVMGQQQESAACAANDLSCRSEMAGNFVSYAMHHAAMLYHDEGTVGYHTHGNVVLQPLLTDPHGWWWSWAAAWASTEYNILIADNIAVGVNRSDMAAGNNLELVNNSLLPWGAAWPPAAAAIIAQAGPRASA